MEVIHHDQKVDHQSVAEAKMWCYIYSYIDLLVLKCANKLDIATIIHNHGKPMTLSELASQLVLVPSDHDRNLVNHDRLYRVLRYMVHMDLLFITSNTSPEQSNHLEAIRFGLAPAGKFLIKGSDMCMVPIVSNDQILPLWLPVEDGLINGETTAFEKVRGKTMWEYMQERPEMNRSFNELMAGYTKLHMPILVGECAAIFREIESLVDVGGGNGTALRNICKAFPHIKCTLYDLPHVIPQTPAAHDDQLPFAVVGGDMFSYIPTADVVLLKSVLHDWGDKECIEILKQCKRAVGDRDGGKVMIVDIVLDDDISKESNHPSITKSKMQIDIGIMLCCGGKERTEAEWKQLIIKDAGYSRCKITKTSSLHSIIEAYP